MMAADVFAPYREALLAEVERQVGALPYTYATLLREQLGRRGGDDDGLEAAALCLIAAESLGVCLPQPASPC
jgi:hypothetical protein